MSYKVLESNGVENENIDGGAFNNFTAGGESGIISGVLDECNIFIQGTSIIMNTGLLLVNGIRIKVESPLTFSLVGKPSVNTLYHIVAKVELKTNNQIQCVIVSRQRTSLTQQNLYKSNSGTHELEIVTFTQFTNGTIGNLVKVAKILENKGSAGLTGEEKQKVNLIKINGNGNSFLSDDGTYKKIQTDIQINASEYYGQAVVVGNTIILNDEASGGSSYDDTEIRKLIGNKVDKVNGKGLSTNDFTTELKTKLENISISVNNGTLKITL